MLFATHDLVIILVVVVVVVVVIIIIERCDKLFNYVKIQVRLLFTTVH